MLGRAQERGFLGPAPIDDHIAHAEGFVAAVMEAPDRALDLGSGGGLPGLVLAIRWPETLWVLLDVNERRTDFLRESVSELGLSSRVTVVRARAEEAAHQEHLRGTFSFATARGFGPPAVTAECATGFLRVGGLLVVSEPPEDAGEDRWNPDGLATLGMALGHRIGAGPHYQTLRQVEPTPGRFPRRAPHKRPLF